MSSLFLLLLSRRPLLCSARRVAPAIISNTASPPTPLPSANNLFSSSLLPPPTICQLFLFLFLFLTLSSPFCILPLAHRHLSPLSLCYYSSSQAVTPAKPSVIPSEPRSHPFHNAFPPSIPSTPVVSPCHGIVRFLRPSVPQSSLVCVPFTSSSLSLHAHHAKLLHTGLSCASNTSNRFGPTTAQAHRSRTPTPSPIVAANLQTLSRTLLTRPPQPPLRGCLFCQNFSPRGPTLPPRRPTSGQESV